MLVGVGSPWVDRLFSRFCNQVNGPVVVVAAVVCVAGALVADASCGVTAATFWAELPAGVAWAWATARACSAGASGVVVFGGVLNGSSAEASAAEAEYAYIVAASWAHISMYWASVAMIAGVFWPKKLVAINVINNTRLAAITGGGTVPINAVS